jgi:hypothetical protein
VIQVLNFAGGSTAIGGIANYIASGNVTYHFGDGVTAPVTLTGRGLYQLRMDEDLPKGKRSESISEGRTTIRAEDGSLSRFPKVAPIPGQASKPIPSSDVFPYRAPMFPGGLALPHQQLAVAMNNPRFNITYKGLVQVDGQAVHDIQVQFLVPPLTGPRSQFHIKHFFIDVSTYQILMTRDLVSKGTIHEIRYSDYKATNGVLIPYSISEEMGGQKTWDIQLNAASFNTALQDSVFALQ